MGAARVSTIPIGKAPPVSGVRYLLKAEMNIALNDIGPNKFVIIPDDERRELEFALETVVNAFAVFGHCKRTLSSASPSIALVPDYEVERRGLESSKGILAHRQSVTSVHDPFAMDSEMLASLGDRLPAAALLAEAHSHNLSAGKFHEYVRVFESAFALPFTQLTKKLLQFLRPVYGYTGDEIGSWVAMRDPLTHADGKKSGHIFLDADVRKVIRRMEQAAYDVLFNKAIWHDRSKTRRDVWKPVAATTSPAGDLVVKQYSTPVITAQLFDEFGVFPMDLSCVMEDPPGDWWFKFGESKAS